MKSFQFNTTAGLRVGSGRSTDTAPEVLSKLGKRILFITDPGLKKLGLIDKTIEALKTNSEIIIFDRVEADPSLKTLMSVVDVVKSLMPLVLLALEAAHPWMLQNFVLY